MTEISMGRIILDARKRKGLTQEKLAERLNISNKTVSKWETGKGYPDAEIIPALTRELGISVSALFGEAPKQDNGRTEKSTRGAERAMRYNQRILASALILLLSPLVIVAAWIIQSYIGVLIGIFLFALAVVLSVVMNMVSFSAVKHLLVGMGIGDYAAKTAKRLASVYSLIWYVLLSVFMMVVYGNPDTFGELELYGTFALHFGFVISLLYISSSLGVDLKSQKNLILLIISAVLFVIGAFCVIGRRVIDESVFPYHLWLCASQLVNYAIVFSTNRFIRKRD